MSIDNRIPSGITSDKPDRSGSMEPKDLAYFGLVRFDTRHVTVQNNDNKDSKTDQGKPYDPDPNGVLKSRPPMQCIFCDKYKTKIEFDLELHLYEKHKWKLLTGLPFRAKGYSMDHRIEYVIYATKTRAKEFEEIKKIQSTAHAIATDMRKLIKPCTINDKHERPNA